MTLNFYMPTKVIMGKGCIKENAHLFKALGNKALIVTGARSAKVNGSQKDVEEALESEGISYVVYDEVMSNPTIECAYEGANLARKEQVDFVIAIGGGSPMDAAKAIALLAKQDIKQEVLFLGGYSEEVLPMIHVPTTAGTGSEVTPYAILTNDAAKTKTSISSPYLFPKIAFLDARYMKNLSLKTTINTAVDALSHAVEGMLSNRANCMCDALAKESITLIMSTMDALKKGEVTEEHREKLLYGSMLAGIVISHTGTTAVHSMGYSLTYFRNIDHGRANGLILGELLSFIEKEKPEVIEALLKVMSLESVTAFKALMNDLLGEKEVFTKEELASYAAIAIKAKNITNCIVTPDQEDVIMMYEAALL